MLKPVWRVSVDTGGTFTDCLAIDPEGREHRAKVLSSSALRARVLAVLDPQTLRLDAAVNVPDGFFVGYRFRRLAEAGPGIEITASREEGCELGLAAPLARPPAVGEGCELLSPEEAPVLAARLITRTPAAAALPPLALRLATTRGTNALLEGKGARVALLITHGFGDLLAIGTQQRPDLFALAVAKVPPLAVRTVEVEERLAADGRVLVPLAPAAVEALGRELAADGIEAVAVAFLHSYRNPVHEEAAAAALGRAGHTWISLSSHLSPLVKILPRAETAVVDAYLAPLLHGYLERVQRANAGGSLHVMTSAGGLVAAASFRPKDSLLSGPAGGVVGMARAGRRAGFERLIGFDMGGTSTDVCRFDRDYDYVFAHRVGAAELVAPALAIETVAAGGGSICRHEDGQLKVGPESAGAAPGPACYGAGGPLTITDVNLLLGRLVPSYFGIPLDRRAAELALAELAAEVPGVTAEELLDGLLAIADERMADAIRSVSVARGYDPSGYALVAFGGAGGQHAAAVAELLGITTVIVPPDAGLLSAVGLGAAVIERFRERPVLAPLTAVLGQLRSWFGELAAAAVAAVVAEGVSGDEVVVRRRLVALRLLGQEATVALEWDPELDLTAAFARAYAELYGYPPPARAIEVESLRVVASSRDEVIEREPEAIASGAAATGHHRAWLGGFWREVPTFDRRALAPGATLVGPALVLERHATTLLPPGWRGRVAGSGALVLLRPT